MKKVFPFLRVLGSLRPTSIFFPTTAQFLPDDMVTLYAEISKQNLEDYLLNIVQKDFDQILNISPLPDGGPLALFVRIPSVPKKIPLASVSAGAARYLNILMALIVTEKGVVLIDEIENGLYWRKMPNVWERMRELCKERDVQLFCVTHSDECLKAAARIAEQYPDDFSIIRTVKTDKGTEVRQFDGKIFTDAMQEDVEIR